jgi:putative redox protein
MTDIKVTPTEFESAGETIRGNFVTPDGEGPFPGICKFHGLPGGRDQVGGIATLLAHSGFAVLTFNFRGFRSSDGFFTLAGEMADAREAISHLQESRATLDSWIGLYGASYGAAIAVCTAASDSRIDAVCLRAPVYDTMWFANSSMIKPMVKYLQENEPDQVHGLNDPEILQRALDSMMDDARNFNPMDSISSISPRPLLIVHGTKDKGIDVDGVKQLYDRAGEPKDFVLVEGADHNLSNPNAYEITMETIVAWFNSQKPGR